MEDQDKLILRKLHRDDAYTSLADVLIGSEFVRINGTDGYKLVNEETFEKANKECQKKHNDALSNFFIFLQRGGFPKFEFK